MLNLTKELSWKNDTHTLLALAYLNKAQRESVQLNVLEPRHPDCLHYLIHAFDVPQ